MPAPRCTILAGPNGSGKSSIYAKLSPPGEFVNADLIEASLPADMLSTARKIRAGKMAVTRLNELIAAKADFAFETTLSSRHALRLMAAAKAAGYDVGLIFVALDSPSRNADRISLRVKRGGHDIPLADIYRRYDAAFRNLPSAVEIAEDVIVIDNSGPKPIIVFMAHGSERQPLDIWGTMTAFQYKLVDAVVPTVVRKAPIFREAPPAP